MSFDPRLQKEVNEAILKLQKLSDKAKTESRAAFKNAAPVLIEAIKARAPVSDNPHKQLGAIYHPGNLRRSIKTLVFRRSSAVFIGPKVDKNAQSGEYKGNRVSGWYAHFVEYGTPKMQAKPFVRPAVAAVGGETLRQAVKALKQYVDRYAKYLSV